MAFDLGLAIKITAGVAGVSAVQGLAGAVKSASGATVDLGASARRAGEEFGRFSASAASAGNVASAALGSIRAQALQLLSALSAIQFARLGIQFNQTLETGRLGIASLIAAQADLADATGRTLTGHEALGAAIAAADDQMTKLRIAGLQTAATTEQLVEAFQQAVGAGLAAGLTLDQIRETTIGIVQAAGALGVPMFQLNEEVRSILGGTINMHSRVAKALGISNEMVNSWKSQGVLVERLAERLAAFRTAGSETAKTWVAIKSNMQEALSVLAGEMTSGLFERLKGSTQAALSGLLDLEAGALAQELQGLAAVGGEVFSRIGQALGAAFEGGVALLVAGLQDGVKLISAVVVKLGAQLVDYVVQPFAILLGLIGRGLNVLQAGWGDALLGLGDQWSGISANAHAYVRQVTNDFGAGRTAVGALRAEWDKFDGAVAKTAKTTQGGLPRLTGRPAPDDDAAKALAKQLAEEQTLLGELLSGVSAKFQKDLATLYEGYQAGRIGAEEYRAAVEKLIFTQTDVGKAAVKAAADMAKAREEENQTIQKGIGDRLNTIAAIREEVERQREHNATIGLTAEQLRALEVSKIDDAIATQERALAIEASVDGADQTHLDLIRAQIAALKDLRAAKVEGAQKEVAAGAAKKAREEWEKTAETVERSLTDALMRGFESGKDFGRNLRDTLVNMFKTLVLRPIIQPIAQAGAGLILGALGLPGVAQAAGGAGGLFGGSGGLGGLGNLGSLVTGGFNSGITSLGTAFGSSLLTDFGLGATFGSALGAEGVALSSASSLGASFGSLGVLGPIGLALGAAALFGGFDGIFGGGGGPKSGGSYRATAAPGGALIPISDGARYFTPSDSDAQLQQLSQSLVTQYTTIVKSLGGVAQSLSVGFGFDTDPQGDAPDRVISGLVVDGRTVSDINNENVARGGYAAELERQASAALLAALQATDLPDVVERIIDSVTDPAALESAVAFAATVMQLRDRLTETRTPLEVAKDQLTTLAGQLGTTAATWKADLLAAIDAGITPEALANWQSLGTLMDQVNAAITQQIQGYTALQAQIRGDLQGLALSAPGVDPVAFWQQRVANRTANLAAATTDEDRLRIAGRLREAILARYQAEVQGINAAADAVAALREQAISLNQYVKSLKTSDLSTLSPESQLQFSGQQFFNAVNRVRAGDTAAFDLLQPRAQTYLEEARGYYASGAQYAAIFETVTATLQSIARDQIAQNPEADRSAALTAAQTEATTALRDLNTTIGTRTAEIQRFDAGTAAVPRDMLANIHAGEIIVDPASSAVLRRYGIRVEAAANDALVAGQKQTVEELRALVRLQSEANRQLIGKLDAMERRLAGIENKARLEAAA
ncbi:MAG: hypothetical protein HYU77_13890 [Betaproteobacteria bacterium]|nr:hypothetical protein [Betaproteobacteria bacterium]